MDDTSDLPDHRYTGAQIALHWIVAGLVVMQWATHDAMEDFWDLVEDGAAGGLPRDPVALLHLASGALVLVTVFIRLALRLSVGAPPLPAGMPPAARIAAHVTHSAFYAVLTLLPLSGAAAIFLGIEAAAGLHGALASVLLLLIVAHLAGVGYHAFIRRDGLHRRMIPAP